MYAELRTRERYEGISRLDSRYSPTAARKNAVTRGCGASGVERACGT